MEISLAMFPFLMLLLGLVTPIVLWGIIRCLAYLLFTIGNPWLKDALRQRKAIIKKIYTLDANELQSVFLFLCCNDKETRGKDESEFE